MPIYALDDVIPQLEDGTWVAPDANIIGKVVLEKMPRFGSAAPCAATTSRSSWGGQQRAGKRGHAHRPRLSAEYRRGCTIGHKAMLHGCTLGKTR